MPAARLSDRPLDLGPLIVMAILIGVSALGLPRSIAALDAARPNIVLIVADDLGYSDIGSFGGEIETPNLDRLATQGFRFTNFHVAGACAPTRSMLMSGVDHHLNGVGNMPEIMPLEHRGKPGYEGVLSANVVTIATMLRDNGYHTYLAGKWHLGRQPGQLPFHRGFERTITMTDSGADNWEQKTYVPYYEKAHWFADGQEHTLPEDFYSSEYYVDKTIEFIEANREDGKPFFAYLAFQAVHIPIQAPAEFVSKYEGKYADGWTKLRAARRDRAVSKGIVPSGAELATMRTTADWDALSDQEKRLLAGRFSAYAGMIDAMDHHIGRLLAYLRRTGQYDDTVFIFTSDNGAEPSEPLERLAMRWWVSRSYPNPKIGAKGNYSWIGASFASAAASPGAYYKFYAGEGGLRVPLVVSWPKEFPSGRISHAFAHANDVVPTLLAVAGVEGHDGTYNGRVVAKMTGRSLYPVLVGAADRVHPMDEPIGYELSGQKALFKGDHKIVNNRPPAGDGTWRLFDFRSDPGEARDLRESMPERFAELRADYDAYAASHGVLEVPAGYDYISQIQTNTIEDRLKPRLRSLATVLTLGAIIFVLLILIARIRSRRTAA